MERSGTVRLNGVDLFVRRFGDDALPPLVVVHGGPAWDHSYLLPAVADLADLRHVVLFDLRGCGRSARVEQDRLQPEYVVDDLVALVDHLGTGPVDLLGFSYGGMIAMSLLARRPELVRTAILASTTAYVDFHAELEASPGYRERSATIPSLDFAALDGTGEGAVSRAMAERDVPLMLWDLSRRDGWLRTLAGVRFRDDWNAPYLAGTLRSPRPEDPAGALLAAGVPLLILHGDREMTFPVAVARRLHAEVPGSRLVLVPEAAHMAHVDNPAAWTGAVRAFLDGEVRRGAA